MKKLLILLCISSLLACNDAANNREKTVQPIEDVHHDEQPATLELNNGAKWKSDESTNKNVAELKAIADQFNSKQPKLTADFINFASLLQNGLDKMIQECRMQGADHEALHHWLQPLIENVNALKKTTTEKDGTQLLDRINERLAIYNQYFE